MAFTLPTCTQTRLNHNITTGPMKKQMGDYGVFWTMVWQQKVEKIVMVTKLKEEGVRTGVTNALLFEFFVNLNTCNGNAYFKQCQVQPFHSCNHTSSVFIRLCPLCYHIFNKNRVRWYFSTYMYYMYYVVFTEGQMRAILAKPRSESRVWWS